MCSGESSSAVAAVTMRSGSVPTNWTVPASTASGRSVLFRRTRIGFPSDGPSSWTPRIGDRHRPAASGRQKERSRADRAGPRFPGSPEVGEPVPRRSEWMDRIDRLYVAALCQPCQRRADVGDAFAEVLAPVRGHHRISELGSSHGQSGPASLPASNSRWTCRTASIPVLPVTAIEGSGMSSRRRLPAAHSVAARCRPDNRVVRQPVHLLRKGLADVARPQACLHVGYGEFPHKKRPGRRRTCVVVPLDHHHIRRFGLEDGLQASDDARGGLEQALARRHDVQVVIRADVERSEHLVERLRCWAVTATRVQNSSAATQVPNDRAQLDRLGPRSKDKQDLFHEMASRSRINCTASANEATSFPIRIGKHPAASPASTSAAVSPSM